MSPQYEVLESAKNRPSSGKSRTRAVTATVSVALLSYGALANTHVSQTSASPPAHGDSVSPGDPSTSAGAWPRTDQQAAGSQFPPAVARPVELMGHHLLPTDCRGSEPWIVLRRTTGVLCEQFGQHGVPTRTGTPSNSATPPDSAGEMSGPPNQSSRKGSREEGAVWATSPHPGSQALPSTSPTTTST